MSEEREVTTLRLLLRCTIAVHPNDIRHEKISLRSLSSTSVSELKHSIQETFDIPSCVQVVKWEGLELKGERRLQDYGIRSEDEITVEYYSEGDCISVQESVQWMSTVIADIKLKGLPTKKDTLTVSKCIPNLNVDHQTLHLRRLTTEFFYPWETPRKYANKLYFIELGGIEMILNLYSLILQNEWTDAPAELKYTEYLILRTFLKFCENFSLQRVAMSHGVLNMLFQSLSRAKIQPGVKFTDDIVEKGWNNLPNLGNIIDGATVVLCNFCELPEGQKYIASKTHILNHSLDILLNPGFILSVTLSIVDMMMQVANQTTSHSFLSQRKVIKALMGVPYCHFDITNPEDYRHVCLSKYSSLKCIARIFLVSPNMLSWLHCDTSLMSTIMDDMENTLQEKSLQEIAQCEEELGYHWCTLQPNISLLYRPSSKLYPKLQQYCQELTVASSHIILSNQSHRKVLIKEGLLDYIICLPWLTSGSVQERAKELVTMIEQAPDVCIQPPSLVNMSKATVAKYCCGLDKVLQLSVPEMVWEMLRN